VVEIDGGRGKAPSPRKETVKVATPEARRFAENLTRIVAKNWPYENVMPPKFEVYPGVKYDKIVRVEMQNNQRSVHAFVDADARVYKAASWNSPVAKPKYEDTQDALRAFRASERDRAIGNTHYLYASYKPNTEEN
jgi:hypothetical protein